MARKRASQAEGRNCEERLEEGKEVELEGFRSQKVKGNLESTKKGPAFGTGLLTQNMETLGAEHR